MTEVVQHEIEYTGDPYEVPERRGASRLALVNGVRAEVDAWRANDYKGASDTTRRLFSLWFEEDPRAMYLLPSQDGPVLQFNNLSSSLIVG